LALPRGGVAIGFEIAQALDAPLDIVLVRKVPWQPELAVGVAPTEPLPKPLSIRIWRPIWTSRELSAGRDGASAHRD
jgi:putative phosphoribosyl transferase